VKAAKLMTGDPEILWADDCRLLISDFRSERMLQSAFNDQQSGMIHHQSKWADCFL